MYRFQCDKCDTEDIEAMTFDQHDEYRRRHPNGHVKIHSGCTTGIFKQVFGVNINKGMPEHYSDQLDTVVRSDAHFKSELSRSQDEMSARMGFDVSYDTIDPSDPAAAGVTEAGLESTERAEHAIKSDGHKSVFS